MKKINLKKKILVLAILVIFLLNGYQSNGSQLVAEEKFSYLSEEVPSVDPVQDMIIEEIPSSETERDYDEMDGRSSTRFDFDPSWLNDGSNPDWAEYLIDLEDTYGDTIVCNFETSAGFTSGIDLTDNISFTIEGYLYGSSYVTETYTMGNDSQQDLDMLHRSIYITCLPYDLDYLWVTLNAQDSYPRIHEGSWIEIRTSRKELTITGEAGDYYYAQGDYYGQLYEDTNAFGYLAQGWTFAHGYHASLRARSDLNIYNSKAFTSMDTGDARKKADITMRVTYAGTADVNAVDPIGVGEYGYHVGVGISKYPPPYRALAIQTLAKGGIDMQLAYLEYISDTVAQEIFEEIAEEVIKEVAKTVVKEVSEEALENFPGVGIVLQIGQFLFAIFGTDVEIFGAREITFEDVTLDSTQSYYLWIGATTAARAAGAGTAYVNFLFSGDPFIITSKENLNEKGIWLHNIMVYYHPASLPVITVDVPEQKLYNDTDSFFASASVEKGSPPYTFTWKKTRKNQTAGVTEETVLKTTSNTLNLYDSLYINTLNTWPSDSYLITVEVTDANGVKDSDSFPIDVIGLPGTPTISISTTSTPIHTWFFLDWEPPIRGWYYDVIEQKPGSSQWSYVSQRQKETFCAILRKIPGTYNYMIRAYNVFYRTGSPSNQVSITLTVPPLDAPQIIDIPDRFGNNSGYSVYWVFDPFCAFYHFREYQWVNLTANETSHLERIVTKDIIGTAGIDFTYHNDTGLLSVRNIHNVTETTAYEYEVAKTRKIGIQWYDGNWTKPVSTEVVPKPTTAPRLFMQDNNSVTYNTHYVVKWLANISDAERYILQRDTNPSFSNPTVYNVTDNENKTAVLDPNTPGTYYHRIRVENIGGNGPWSNVSTKTVVSGVIPNKPIIQSSKNVVQSEDAYVVSWGPVNAEQHYKFKESTSYAFQESQTTTTYYLGWEKLPTREVVLNHTTEDTTYYYYKVKPIPTGIPEENCPWSDVITVQVIGSKALPAPILYDPGDKTARYESYDVTWKPIGANARFQIEESIYPTFPPTETNTFSTFSGSISKFSDAHGIIIHPKNTQTEPISSTTTYYYRIRAIDEHSYSPWSEVVDMKVYVDEGQPPQTAPTITSPVNGSVHNSTTPFNVSWTPVDGATFYILQEGEYFNGIFNFPTDPADQIYSGNTTSLTLFRPVTKYPLPLAYRVLAGNYAGPGRSSFLWSPPIYVTLLPKQQDGGILNPGTVSDGFRSILNSFLGNIEGQAFLNDKLSNPALVQTLNTNAALMTMSDSQGGGEDSLNGIRHLIGSSIADYDNDHSLDIAKLEDDQTIRIYDKTGAVIDEFVGLNGAIGVCIGDLNDDEANDFVVTEYTAGTVTVFDQSKSIVHEFLNLTGPIGTSIGDFNNDGSNDIAIAEYSIGTVTVYNKSGDIIKQFLGLDGPQSVSIQDFSRDGYNDIAITTENGNVEIFFGIIDHRNISANVTNITVYNPYIVGTYIDCLGVPLPDKSDVDYCDVGYESLFVNLMEPLGSAVGDFYNDGIKDIALINPMGVNVYDEFGQFIIDYFKDNPVDVAFGDFNGDYEDDIAISSEDGTISIYDAYGYQFDEFYGENPRGISIGDFDNNGENDIAIASEIGEINIYNQYHDLIHTFYGLNTPQGVSIHGMNSNEFNEFILSDKQPLPVGIWDFDEGDGDIAHDASGFENHGTIIGAEWTDGYSGSALYFDGGGQWHDGDGITVPHSSSLDITSPFTVSAMIKATGSDSYNAIVDKYQHSAGDYGFSFYLNNGKIRFTIYSGDDGNQNVIGQTDLRNQGWKYVVGEWDGSYLRVYVNDTLEGEQPWSYPPGSTTNNLGIGKRLSGWGGYLPFEGTIDEVFLTQYTMTLHGHYQQSPPFRPTDPSPAHDDTGVLLESDLSWTGGDPDPSDTVFYDVYFGTNTSPPLVSHQQTMSTYDLPSLEYDTTYYWQIIAQDNHGIITPSPLWSFTTKTNSLPYLPYNLEPENNATNLPIALNLSWTGGDPDVEDTVTYDVYFGSDFSNLTLLSQDQSSTTYHVDLLFYNTVYYWFIVAQDNNNGSKTSPIWTFTTEMFPEHLMLYPTDDSYVDWYAPDDINGGKAWLVIRPVDSWEISTLIKFDLSFLPQGTTIESAALNLYHWHWLDSNPAGRILDLHHITSDWNEETVTYNTRPSWDPSIISSAFVPAVPPSPDLSGEWMTWNLTNHIQEIVDGVTENYGWQVSGHFMDNPMIYFRSKENLTDIPYLEIKLAPSAFRDWSMFRHDSRHTGFTNEPGPLTNNILWTFQTDDNVLSSPAVADDIVYVGSGDSKLYAINALSGTEIWNFTTEDSIWSSPAVSEEMVVIGSSDGYLYALHKSNGTEIWRSNLGGIVRSSPLIYNGIIYVGSYSDYVYAVYANNGTIKWSYQTQDNIRSSPSFAYGMILIGSRDGKLYALNADTGAEIWSFLTGDEVESSPCVSNGIVYVGSNDNNLYAIYATNGTEKWSYPTGGAIWSSPAISDDVIYVGSADNHLHAINANDGNLIWMFPTSGDIRSCPAVSQGIVYIGSNDDKIYAVNISDGTEIWSYTTGENVPSSPAIANGILFIGSNDDKIYAFRSFLKEKISFGGSCFYPDISPVNNLSVDVINLDTGQRWQADTIDNYYSLALIAGQDINVSETIRLIARDENELVNITDYTINQTEMDFGTVLLDLILNEFYLNLKDFPMYEAEEPYNEMCGPATAKMTLDYIWWNSSQNPEGPPDLYNQSDLYQAGLENNTNQTSPYLDTRGLWYIIQYNKPIPYSEYGYNFLKYSNEDLDEMLKRICLWINYTIGTVGGYKPGHPLHVPAVVPAYGDYTNWMAIRGFHANRTAHPMPDEITIYGFWVNDPYPSSLGGLGENSYKMLATWVSDYYQPLETDDIYNGKYVAIFEPPETNENAVLTIAEPRPKFTQEQQDQLKFIQLNRDLVSEDLVWQSNQWIIQAAIEGVAEELIPYDDDFAAAFAKTIAGKPMFVENTDGNNYYAVPFNLLVKKSRSLDLNKKVTSKENTIIVVLIDAEDGSFKEASWVKDPVKYLPISEKDAQKIVYATLEEMGYDPDDIETITMNLVHRDSTLYYPDWKVTIDELGLEFFIGQDGTIS